MNKQFIEGEERATLMNLYGRMRCAECQVTLAPDSMYWKGECSCVDFEKTNSWFQQLCHACTPVTGQVDWSLPLQRESMGETDEERAAYFGTLLVVHNRVDAEYDKAHAEAQCPDEDDTTTYIPKGYTVDSEVRTAKALPLRRPRPRPQRRRTGPPWDPAPRGNAIRVHRVEI